MLAGAAAAVKYTGVVYVALPLGAWLVWRAIRGRASWRAVAAAVAGGAIVFGPWLVKNAIETGNPVYPLAYSVFGGVDLDDEWAARWHDAHAGKVPWSQPAAIPGDFAATFWSVAVATRFQSVLLLAFAPIGAVAAFRMPVGRGCIVVCVWIGLVYYGATHRIDRFWLPLLPAASVLVAAGLLALRRRLPSLARVAFWGATAFHLLMMWYLAPPQPLRMLAQQREEAKVGFLRALEGTEGGRVLLVGEAQVFEADADVIYATVFDRSPLHRYAAAGPNTNELANAEEICRRLRADDIVFIAVNWAEVLRYRLTYGTTDFDSYRTIEALQRAGVIGRPYPMSDPTPTAELTQDERRELAAIGFDLSEPGWVRWEFYQVDAGCRTGGP